MEAQDLDEDEFERLKEYIKNIIRLHQGNNIRLSFVSIKGNLLMESIERLTHNETHDLNYNIDSDEGDGFDLNFNKKDMRYIR